MTVYHFAMKEDKKIYTIKRINPNLKIDMMTTKMEAIIFQVGRH